jgi:hypothetical protein
MTGPDDLQPPCSRKQLSKLGERPIGPSPSAADWALYGEVIDFFDASTGRLRDQIGATDWTTVLGREVSASVTGRAKTRGTLLDKLRRTPAIGMGYVRDIAGVRIVGDFTLSEQDAVVSHLVETLDPLAKIIDRREEPQAGYRAGACDRYKLRSLPPDDDQLIVGPLITALQQVSTEHIAQSEAMQQQVTEVLEKYATLADELPGHPSVSERLERAKELQERIESAKRRVREMLREVLASLDDLVS